MFPHSCEVDFKIWLFRPWDTIYGINSNLSCQNVVSTKFACLQKSVIFTNRPFHFSVVLLGLFASTSWLWFLNWFIAYNLQRIGLFFKSSFNVNFTTRNSSSDSGATHAYVFVLSVLIQFKFIKRRCLMINKFKNTWRFLRKIFEALNVFVGSIYLIQLWKVCSTWCVKLLVNCEFVATFFYTL